MRKLKVCWISNIPSPYKTAVMNLLGKKTELIALYEKKGESDREESWYDRGFTGFTGIYLDRHNFRRVIDDCAERCDCLIDSDYSNPLAMYACRAFKKKKKPVFLQADGGLVIPRGPVDKVISAVMKYCDFYISPGRETDRYFAYYGIPQEKIEHYRFCSMNRQEIEKAAKMREDKEEYRRRNGITGPNVLLSVGQQIPRKGYDILLKALKDLGEDCETYIIGGEPEPEVKRYAEENRMDSVHFIPFLSKEKLAEYYAAADLFVLATRYDIWGLVINEAMAYGLPVVSTDRCVAAAELNARFGNAVIVPAEDPDALREALRRLIRDPAAAKRMGDASLRGIQEYTLENMSGDLLSILEKHTDTV